MALVFGTCLNQRFIFQDGLLKAIRLISGGLERGTDYVQGEMRNLLLLFKMLRIIIAIKIVRIICTTVVLRLFPLPPVLF